MSRTDARSTSLRRRPSRSVTAAVVAVLLVAVGVALVWASVARLAQSRWPVWVTSTHRWANDRTWGSGLVVTIALVVALLGLVLLAAALRPGALNAYTLAPLPDGVDDTGIPSREAVMTRRSVARLATAHARLVDGVESTRASVSGRTVSLAVTTTSAHRDTVQEAVTEAVSQALGSAGLDPMPKVSARVRTQQP